MERVKGMRVYRVEQVSYVTLPSHDTPEMDALIRKYIEEMGDPDFDYETDEELHDLWDDELASWIAGNNIGDLGLYDADCELVVGETELLSSDEE